MLDKQKIADNINRYQKGGYFHPLTCRVDSSHALLIAQVEPELNNQIVLLCPTCEYIQYEDQIPDMFLNPDFDKLMDKQDEYYKQWRKDVGLAE